MYDQNQPQFHDDPRTANLLKTLKWVQLPLSKVASKASVYAIKSNNRLTSTEMLAECIHLNIVGMQDFVAKPDALDILLDVLRDSFPLNTLDYEGITAFARLAKGLAEYRQKYLPVIDFINRSPVVELPNVMTEYADIPRKERMRGVSPYLINVPVDLLALLTRTRTELDPGISYGDREPGYDRVVTTRRSTEQTMNVPFGDNFEILPAPTANVSMLATYVANKLLTAVYDANVDTAPPLDVSPLSINGQRVNIHAEAGAGSLLQRKVVEVLQRGFPGFTQRFQFCDPTDLYYDYGSTSRGYPRSGALMQSPRIQRLSVFKCIGLALGDVGISAWRADLIITMAQCMKVHPIHVINYLMNLSSWVDTPLINPKVFESIGFVLHQYGVFESELKEAPLVRFRGQFTTGLQVATFDNVKNLLAYRRYLQFIQVKGRASRHVKTLTTQVEKFMQIPELSTYEFENGQDSDRYGNYRADQIALEENGRPNSKPRHSDKSRDVQINHCISRVGILSVDQLIDTLDDILLASSVTEGQ